MRFTEVKINHFGKLQGEEITFAPGMNVICGDNESGKSTLHTFLRSMLFGMRRGRGRASRQDTFARYEPWDNPGAYGGILRFESGGKKFRLTRRFARGNTWEELVCETDGERLDIGQGDLQMLLGNVSPAIFDNTVSAGQLRCRTESELYDALQNYMANCRDTGDGSLDVSRALEILKNRQRQEEREEQREQQGLLERQRELESRLEYLKEEQANLTQKYRQEREKLEQYGKENSGEEFEDFKEEEQLPGMFPAYFLLGICLVAAVGIFLGMPGRLAVRGGIGVVFLLLGAVLFWGQVRKRKAVWRRIYRERELHRRESLRRQQGRLLWTQEKARLQGSLQRLQESLGEKETETANLQVDLEECLQERNRRSNRREKIEGLQLARETIGKLADSHRSRYGGQLKKRVSEIMEELTGGDYDQVFLEENFQMRLHAGDRELALEQVSRGTAEQLYFALRMAAGEVLCREESLPLLLDETFAMYDEKRLEAALQWLHKNREQTLLFTCQKREEEMLKKLGIPYHRIELKKERGQIC